MFCLSNDGRLGKYDKKHEPGYFDIGLTVCLTGEVCLSVLHRDEARVLQFHYFSHYLRVLQMFADSLKTTYF